ncbi:FecR family protein [Phocaeicola abscessus]|uniref:FecR family protein n=1 Tax=Phocaeicola abscessus TaxID=555313 RepID=UPI0028E8BD3D|nr:FecR domain-containing protein [Phocaeicola abscessus]
MKNQISYLRETIARLIAYYRKQETLSTQAERERIWFLIDRGIDRKIRRRRLRRLAAVMTVAAVIVGCIWIVSRQKSITERERKPIDIMEIAAQMICNTTSTDEIRLIVSPTEMVPVDKGAVVIYSPNGISVNEEKITENETRSEEMEYDQILVPKGKYTRLILADGSSMFINAGTSVVFPKKFREDKREIFVDGEVYLDVMHDEQAPFVVKTVGFEVQVQGTAFNINAYSSSLEINEVVLVRGKVNVKSKSGKELTLLPNNKAKIYHSGEMEKSNVNAADYTLWTQGILNLRIAPLSAILTKLSRYYGVDITCESNIADIDIAGKIDLKCSVDEALKRISATGGFLVSKRGDTYGLKAK